MGTGAAETHFGNHRLEGLRDQPAAARLAPSAPAAERSRETTQRPRRPTCREHSRQTAQGLYLGGLGNDDNTRPGDCMRSGDPIGCMGSDNAMALGHASVCMGSSDARGSGDRTHSHALRRPYGLHGLERRPGSGDAMDPNGCMGSCDAMGPGDTMGSGGCVGDGDHMRSGDRMRAGDPTG